MKRFCYVVIFIAVVICRGSILETVKSDISNQRYDEALVQLEQIFKARPNDPEINFYLGQVYSALGDLEAAFMAYERMEIADPSLNRAKVELGQTCFKLGLYDLSRRYFEAVLEQNLPKNVEENVRLFLSRIQEDRRRHYFSGKLTLSLGADNNISGSPDGTIFLPNGLPVDVEEEGGAVFTQILDLRHEYRYFPAVPHIWATDFMFYNTMYDTKIRSGIDELNLDLRYLRLRSGPRFYFDDYNLEVKGKVGHLTSGNEDYLRTVGLEVALSTEWEQKMWLAANLGVDQRDYVDREGIDGLAWTLTVSPTWVYDSSMLSVALGGELFNADWEVNSYSQGDFSAFYIYQFAHGINLSAGYDFLYRTYDADDGVFDERRKDQVHQWTASCSKLVWQSTLLEMKYRYEIRESTLDSYEFDKHSVELALTVNF